MDEATFSLKPYITRSWFRKGSKPVAKYVLNKFQKIHVFGALTTRKVLTRQSQKINSREFLLFIKRLNKRYKKLCVVHDNAAWHLTKNVQKYFVENEIKVIRLLPYSPELNPIEQYWKNLKQNMATKFLFSKDDIKNELKSGLRKNIFIPNISNY